MSSMEGNMNDIRFPLPVRLVDHGTAPEVYADGLARVEQLGAATLFALYRLKTTIVDGQSQQVREVMQHIIMPTDAVGPAVELTLLDVRHRTRSSHRRVCRATATVVASVARIEPPEAGRRN